MAKEFRNIHKTWTLSADETFAETVDVDDMKVMVVAYGTLAGNLEVNVGSGVNLVPFTDYTKSSGSMHVVVVPGPVRGGIEIKGYNSGGSGISSVTLHGAND